MPGDGDRAGRHRGRGAGRGAIEVGRDWLVPPPDRDFDDPAEAAWSRTHGARRSRSRCFTEPVRLTRPLEDYPFSRTYIKATGEPRPEPAGPFWAAADRARRSPLALPGDRDRPHDRREPAGELVRILLELE